uniref:BRO1 domain-containing protein n=1 Tax=Globodera pallida TaxID=36090 RepID=A0A183CL72_GLOPA
MDIMILYSKLIKMDIMMLKIQAQAQECMLEKSMIDQRKPMVVARVALHLYNIYQQCDEHLKSSGLADLLSSSRYKEVDRLCGAKSHLYGAISSYYLGQQADDEQQYGTRLAYFARALAHINIAVQLCEKDEPNRHFVKLSNSRMM